MSVDDLRSPPADYGVYRSSKAAAALQQLPKHLRSATTQLSLHLVLLVRAYPERVFRRLGGGMYRHPEPFIEITFQDDAPRRAYRITHIAAPLPPRVQVYISYSHSNDKLRRELG